MDYEAIEALRARHPAWRLLRAGNASLILSFLGDFFVEKNRGACSASEVAAALDDQLYALNREAATDDGAARFPQGTTGLPGGLGRGRGWLPPAVLSSG